MIKLIETINFKQLSSDLEEIKQEILNYADDTANSQDEVLLEVIRVIQEEIVQHKKNSKKSDIKNEVKFLAYLNLFNSIMKESMGDFGDELDESDDDMDLYEEDDEEIDEHEK